MIETKSKLPVAQNWVQVHELVDHDAGLKEKTEVLELPHGCLVRTTVMQGAWTGSNIATALAFVPNLKLERGQDMVEFKHKR